MVSFLMDSNVHPENDRRRQKRRVGLLAGLLAAGYVGGSFVAVPRIENNLTDKVEGQLALRGITDAHVTFSGQDGTVSCASGIADTAAIRAEALARYGVHEMKFDAACAVAQAAPVDTVAPVTPVEVTLPATTPATEAVAPASIAAVATVADAVITLSGEVASAGQKTTLVQAATGAFGEANVIDKLTVAKAGGDTTASDDLAQGLAALVAAFPDQLVSGEAGIAKDALYLKGGAASADALKALTGIATGAGAKDSDVKLVAAAAAAPNDALVAAAVLADGKITLTGTVSTEAQKQALFDAAAKVIDPSNITDNIVVQAAVNVDQANVDSLATLIAAMPPNLISGETGFDGTKLYATGVYISDATRAAFETAATSVGVTPTLEARQTGTVDDAAAIQRQLNDYVAANPIQFESGQAVLTPEANLILDQVAVYAKQLAGLTIEIQGHTDNQGSAANNLTLSENRAKAVLDALVGRAVPAEQLTSKGFGLTTPKVPNDTAENRALNRRVEFAVSTK